MIRHHQSGPCLETAGLGYPAWWYIGFEEVDRGCTCQNMLEELAEYMADSPPGKAEGQFESLAGEDVLPAAAAASSERSKEALV